ncbi:carbohydrate-binding, CenC-like protein, partial [Tanacetum coccineum]
MNSEKNRHTLNIIDNHTFSNGLHAWYANCCDAFLVSPSVDESTQKSCKRNAVVTNRTQNWQGLEQDITRKVSPGSTYKVSALVGVSGTRLKGKADVIATIKLEYKRWITKYRNIARSAVSKDKWANLEGTFVLPDKPDRIVLYIEGPAPGVNILIESVCVLCH